MKARSIFIIALVLSLWTAVFVPSYIQRVNAQQTLFLPTVFTSSASPLIVVAGWTGGTVNNGGHGVTVASGTASLTTGKNDCSAPGYANCNFVFANSTGTVSISTSLATANAAGNSLLAYVEVANNSTVSNIVYPGQSSSVGLVRAIQNCGTAAACANTNAGTGLIEVFGSVALVSGTPSSATLTSLPFTTSGTYFCVGSPVGTTAAIAAGGVSFNNVVGTSTQLTGPNTVTTVIDYICRGT